MRVFSFLVLFSLCGIAQAGGTFIHPSSWGIPDDDHYNTYIEDEGHPCHVTNGVIDNPSECRDVNSLTLDGYVNRDCGYGGQCSYPLKQWSHAGIDYDFPYHEHDPVDYENGQRKPTDLQQGKNMSLPHHNGDDIVASNDGVVVFAEAAPARTNFGNNVILRHLCNTSSQDAYTFCVPEGDHMVIYTQYSHMSNSVVSKGDVVYRGQKIGEIGGTGGWIHHLHFEFKTKGVLSDPDGHGHLGYAPGDPSDVGYFNPLAIIDNVNMRSLDNAYSMLISELCSGANLSWLQKLINFLRGEHISCDQGPVDGIITIVSDVNTETVAITSEDVTFLDGSNSVEASFQEIGITKEEVEQGTTTNPQTPPPLNHDHRIALESVRIDESGNNWHYDTTYKGEKTFVVRVKLEEKEGREAKNVCTTIYRSDNLDFSRSQDTKLADKECMDIAANDNPSVYFEDLDIPPDGMHYIFADIEPEGYDHNISSPAGEDAEGHREYATYFVEPVWADLIVHSVGSQTVAASSGFRIPFTVANNGNAIVTCDTTNRSEILVNGAWQFVANDATQGANLDPGVNHPEDMAGTAPSTPGTYQVRACADSTNCVSESDELNNCGYGTLTVTPPPRPDLGIESVGTASVYPSEQFRIGYYVVNSGTANGSVDIISRSEVNNGGWKFVADDTTQAGNLPIGARHYEDMAGTAPSTPGTYQVRACADHGNRQVELNEANNCGYGTLTVKAPPPPTITWHNPAPGEQWRSSSDHTIRWSSTNMPSNEKIRIDYYNYNRWTTIYDGYTTNDGSKVWKMDHNKTIDDHNARLRIVRLSDGKVIGVSYTFFIDRKKPTPKW